MKQLIIGMVCGLMMIATAAQAEHKLLVTDVLDPMQMEGKIAVNYSHYSSKDKIEFSFFTDNWSYKSDSYEIEASLGIGLFSNFEIYASMPYLYKADSEFTRNNSWFGSTFVDRWSVYNLWGDLTLGAKYRFYDGGKDGLKTVVGLAVTADDMFGDRHAYAPYLAASTTINNNLRPFASYTLVFNDDNDAKLHSFCIGAEYIFNSYLSLQPSFTTTFHTNMDNATNYETFSMTLPANVQLLRNLYLIPEVNFSLSTTSRNDQGTWHHGPEKSVGGGLALYYLF